MRDEMKQRLWRSFKFLVPIITFATIAKYILKILEEFWAQWIPYQSLFSHNGEYIWLLKNVLSLILTIAALVILSYILGISWIRRSLNYLSKKSNWIGYFWSDDTNTPSAIPVIFQNPMEGQWKLGLYMGEQRMDDGSTFHKIFYVTGIGDHTFIDTRRPDLLIFLKNPTPEVAKLITSMMSSGPNSLIRKKTSDNATGPSVS